MSRRPDWLCRLMMVDKAVQARVCVEDRAVQTEDQYFVGGSGLSLKDRPPHCVEQMASIPPEDVESLVELPTYRAWRWR